ncbi:hypothetical protein SAMN06893096_106245 [Geodermatophilus pulveris]|uniref:Uncharacterized protein n=1 Tax=Geodermatophilus pulveris TaxID=1564159 RepID=A0A239GK00_9ACTN|nr:hypothetical protein [Geodermatophilus pulveris]SNS69497.1 hypothetical protein SAMN06893096_106245 [Geodermatophilus pulveris]
MSRSTAHGRGDWMSLLDGVRVSRRWMTRHTPALLAAWCDAPTAEHRRAIAVRILQIAADLESEPDDADDTAAESTWSELVAPIDARLVRGPDWPPLAAALTRAAATDYDIAARLPALAAAAPLPARHPARELHWRLLDDCPDALPPLRPTGDRTATAAGAPVVHNSTGRPQIPYGVPPGWPRRPSLDPADLQNRRPS